MASVLSARPSRVSSAGLPSSSSRRAQGPQEQVAEVGGVGAEPPGLGQRQDDIGGPVLQRVDRAAEPVDGLVGVADDDGLRRLVQDDAAHHGVHVLGLVEEDDPGVDPGPGQRPDLQVVVVVDPQRPAGGQQRGVAGVGDVRPGFAGVGQHGPGERAAGGG